MIRRVWLSGLVIVFCAALSLAADLNGRWEGSMSTPNGDFSLVFNYQDSQIPISLHMPGRLHLSQRFFRIYVVNRAVPAPLRASP